VKERSANPLDIALAAGADSVAVISALCAAPDPEAATRAFLARIAPGAAGLVR